MNNNTNKRAAPRQFAISKFADTYDTGIEREDATWNDLVTKLAENPPEAATKEGLHLLKLAKFGDTINPNGSALRHNANVEFLSGIVAEHDAGTVSFEEAVTRLKAAGSDGVAAFIYQSPSHMKDGKGPRWRVLAPLSVDTDPAQHGPLMDKLNGVLGGALAPESWTLSQIYYYGRVTDREYYKPERIKGHHLDKLVGITPIGKGGGRLAEARVIRGIERDEEHEPSIEETELSKLV
ncbi:MAG: hypothetical protein ABI640_02570, partial [Gammaproteobacteria bacterium]